ncbi:unnamed protein product [Acanthoscelides obtectus]|uniref:Post-GPI attachment to proteins factor 3 n=1 Tax=Acanthoscelides obtectus TaxID=200917 RepID=A0A9P0LG13_ACAOB|nr:unnamed protein product [Acanthoscelides obtectus]CAK1624356.1 Post-GPI attachment to proteins factor 3 [Acanthoscelides obtectus]
MQVCVHAWFWSAVFHTRDFPLTELLDYACAFSIVLMNCYVMVIRFARGRRMGIFSFYECKVRLNKLLTLSRWRLKSHYKMDGLLRNKVPKFALITISSFFMAFFINHAVYLSMGRIDYGYNMELNILIGTFTAVCWFGWCIYNRKQQPHVWKCAIFVALTGAVMLLEITDTPPFFHVFDCHSLWHLSTAPLVTLIYSLWNR